MGDKNSGSAWKWVAGALAIALSYNVGYESGFSANPPLSPPSTGLSYEATPDVTAVDGTTLPADPLLTAAVTAPAAGGLPKVEVPQHLRDKLEALANEPQLEERPSLAVAGDYSSFPLTEEEDADEAVGTAAVLASDQASDSTGSEERSAYAATIAAPIAPDSYLAPKSLALGCAENGSCYGDISVATGRAKTVAVRGYYRSDGTYVRGHYRSKPR